MQHFIQNVAFFLRQNQGMQKHGFYSGNMFEYKK